jgi:hypothetical protein
MTTDDLGMPTTALPGAHEWRSPLHCGAATCAQVAVARDAVYIRDSKDPEGTPLRFTHAEWRAFVASVRDGQFDV